jgi:competence protein ComEC
MLIPANGLLFGLSYLIGLLLTAIPVKLLGIPVAALGLLALGGLAAFLLPGRLGPMGPSKRDWLMATGIALFAMVYLFMRTPQAGMSDISRLIPEEGTQASTPVVTVQGVVETVPRLTRRDRIQFWIETRQVIEVAGSMKESQTGGRGGRLYVTVPLLQGTGLYPGNVVEVTGVLYKPQPPTNPGMFDFSAYLAKQGGFAGLSAYQVSLTAQQPKRSAWWELRQRVVQSQVKALGSPLGPLLSAIVLGNRAVDLPYDVRDGFARVGLAHAIAVSGFHVSLVLGFVMVLTRRLSARFQFLTGVIALGGFVWLTGMQPSILRAALMGVGSLAAIVVRRKVKPIGLLSITAGVLLLIDPTWIWDLGFQLSFLATLGLLSTSEAILRRLQRLPIVLGALIAVPLAATIWTLPLQLYQFGTLAPYSLMTNVITSPLISFVSIGGIFSAMASVAWPAAGSVLAGLLSWPMQWFWSIAQFFGQLPGANWSLGRLSWIQLAIIYGLMILAWRQRWWQRRWWLAALFSVMIATVPMLYDRATLTQITVLSTNEEPVLVVQDRGQVGLVNCGDEKTAQTIVVPFLKSQGINQIQWAIATQPNDRSRIGWIRLFEQLPVEMFYEVLAPQGRPTDPLGNWTMQTLQTQISRNHSQYAAINLGQTLQVKTAAITTASELNGFWSYRSETSAWTWLLNVSLSDQRLAMKAGLVKPADILWWSDGKVLSAELLDALQPKVAISSAKSIDQDTLSLLKARNIKVFWTGRDGAIQWSKSGVEPAAEVLEVDRSEL